MKLTKPQRAALEWLLQTGGWAAAWWGGSPHTGWPKELRENTYSSLASRGLIQTQAGEWATKRTVITDAGRKALQ